MSFGNYSLTPAANISCNGINIGENCPAANVNNVLRQLMADGKELADTVSLISVSSYLPLVGGSVTGNIVRSGAGPHLFHMNGSFSVGSVYIQQQAASLPSSPGEGAMVFTYA